MKWTDNAGVTHYTNLKGEVPSQEAAQVVVDETVWLPQGPTPPEVSQEPVAPPQAPAVLPEPPRDTVDDVHRAYLAGLDSGLGETASSGGDVYISGPLAVVESPPPSDGSYGYVTPGDDWVVPGYAPFVTTPVIGLQRPRRNPVASRFPSDLGFTSAAGPPPIGAAGPSPHGAAGPPPLGAAGRPPTGAAVSGSRFLR